MNSTLRIGSAIAGSALAVGLVVGGVAAVANDNGDPASAASETPQHPKPAVIQGTLDNGKTYGYWTNTTPDDDRPDYMPADLADGKTGYLKVAEAFPPIDPRQFESSDEGRRLRAEYMDSKIKPDENGDVWAPAYGEDGETVIGKVLIATANDELE